LNPSNLFISTFIEGEFESLFIETTLLNKNTIIGEIYRTPGSNAKSSLEHFENIISKLKGNRQVLIGTDSNYDLLKMENHPSTASFFNTFMTNSFLPAISKPTRITDHSATLIDNIYINNMTQQTDFHSCILLEDISDHLPIFCSINVKTNRSNINKSIEFERRCLSPEAMESIKIHLEHIDWTDLNQLTVENAFMNFNERLNRVLDKFAPKIKIKIPKNRVMRDPWMTKGLMISSKNATKLYRKSIGKSKNDEKYINYRNYRNKYNQLKRTAKQTYYKDLFDRYRNDSKSAWRTINDILNRSNDKRSITRSFNVDGTTITDPKSIADEFCTFFNGIGRKYANKIPVSNVSPQNYTCIKRAPNHKSVYIVPTDQNEIEFIISRLKPKKSSGHDGITPYLLNNIKSQISNPISTLINMSIETSVVPDCLKLAKIVPIYKAKQKNDFANYRPVSLLPAISKILEKVIYKRLYTFLDSSNIFNGNQFGFRTKHNTIDAVTKFVNDITESLDKKESSLAIYCDLSRAFDTIDHEILLNKLQFYGIRGQSLDWFRSYLDQRKQYVEYDGYISNTTTITLGVPQGSVLGPLLFIIYMNDLPDNLTTARSILFADDTTLYDHNSNIDILYANMTNDLEKLTDWFWANKLSLNLSKTYYMLFTNSRLVINNLIEIKIGNEVVKRTSQVKFLGMIIDDQLKWNKHIDVASKRISSAFYAINSAKHVLNRKYLKTLYYALVYPHIIYGITLWGNTYNVHLNKIIILQKKIVRVITNSEYNTHSEPLFKMLQILKITDIYQLQVVKFVFSYINHCLPILLMDTFTTIGNPELHYTRQVKAFKLKLPKARTTVSTRCITNMGPKIWNNVPSQMYFNKNQTNFVSTKCFMSRYKCDILSSYTDR